MTVAIQPITSPHVPESPAPFSQCLVVGDQIFLSGMTAAGPNGQPVGEDDMTAQARACLNKISHLLRAAGSGLEDIVKLTIYTTDIARRADISAARRELLQAPYPCSTLVEVRALASPGLLVEIDAVAIRGARSASTSSDV